MAAALTALEYLERPDKHPPRAVMVVYGEERFLKRLVIDAWRTCVLGESDAGFGQTAFEGRSAALRDVLDEVNTVGLFGGGARFVLVEEADEFVTRNRAALEDFVARPAGKGTLVLDVRTWPANTRLYKAVAGAGLQVDCAPPKAAPLRKWLPAWCKTRYGKQLAGDALDQLLELVGQEPGLLDQELAKLSAAVGKSTQIARADVDEFVGGWRARTTWEMLDAALDGHAPEALAQLEQLLLAGENPVGLLGQIGSSLRRLAAATRRIERGEATGERISLREALEEAGVRPFVLAKSEAQLRQLGRKRAGELYRWLLEADLGLKGDSALPPRLILEHLIARMAREDTGTRTAAGSRRG